MNANKLNCYQYSILEHFYVKFGDSRCIGERDTRTNRTPVTAVGVGIISV